MSDVYSLTPYTNFCATVNKEIEKTSEIVDLRGFFGPSWATRIPSPVNPNHVRYHLRYTRIHVMTSVKLRLQNTPYFGPSWLEVRDRIGKVSTSLLPH